MDWNMQFIEKEVQVAGKQGKMLSFSQLCNSKQQRKDTFFAYQIGNVF